MVGNPVIAHGAKVVHVSVTLGADDDQQRHHPNDHCQRRPEHVALSMKRSRSSGVTMFCETCQP